MKKQAYKILRTFYRLTFKRVKYFPIDYLTQKYLKQHWGKVSKKWNENKAINVVFVFQFPEMWNSLKTVYEAFKKDARFKTQIIALSQKESISKNQYKSKNIAYEFCVNNGMEAIKGNDTKGVLNIETLDPDIIFLQRPYDDRIFKEYALANIRKKGLMFYVPYSSRLTQGIHMDIEFNKLRHYYCTVFADCIECEEYLKKNQSPLLKEYQYIYNIGFPRFDLIHPSRNTQNKINTFLWLPRWSVLEKNNISHFANYYEVLFDYFERHADLKLIIRPHPLMFDNFVDTGYMTRSEVNQIITRIESSNNVSLDKNSDYLVTFENSDALISDTTSLLLEFFFTGKPVILCDHIEDLTCFGNQIVNTFNIVNNEEELLFQIEQLLKGNDFSIDNRYSLIDKYYFGETKIGEKIVQTVAKMLDVRCK